MSTPETQQQQLDGGIVQTPGRSDKADLSGFSRVLWEIGESSVDNTERQLRMAARICAEREMFNGGGSQ